MQFTIRLGSRLTWRVLVTCAAVLALGHCVAMALNLGLGYHTRTLQLLDLNEERSFGTIFSVAVLVANAGLLTIFAFAARRSGGLGSRESSWWAGLAVLFLFMSADEVFGIHESLIDPLRQSLHPSGALHFAWVVPYTALVVTVAALYTPFLLRLPRETAIRLVIAGAVYVGGAIGMEMVAGKMEESHGYAGRALPMETEYLVEESMEMLGAIYFLTALLRHVERRGEPVVLVASLPDALTPSPCEETNALPSSAAPTILPPRASSCGSPCVRSPCLSSSC